VPHFSHNGKQQISSLPGTFVTLVILVMVLIVGLDRILTYNDTFHKTEYRVVQKLFEPAANQTALNFTDLHFAVGLQYKEEY
jgi:hypothetical protein